MSTIYGNAISAKRSVVVVALLFGALFYTAWYEQYLKLISLLLGALLIVGAALSLWGARTLSTRRIISIILVTFIFEYTKESMGISVNAWRYTGPGGQFTLGVWAWVVVTLGCVVVTTNLTGKLWAKTKIVPPRWLAPIIVVVVFAIIPLTMGPYMDTTNLFFWIFYSLAVAFGIVASYRMNFSIFFGLVITTWLLGFPSEYAGSTSSGIWQFTHNTTYPPFYLLAGCWPLEMLTHYALSALLAGEPPFSVPGSATVVT